MPRFASYDVGDQPIDGYRLIDFLGTGQFGEVWKATDTAADTQVAVKIIDLTYSPTALKELRALHLVRRLSHPNLVPILMARLIDRGNREVPFEQADDVRAKGQLKQLVIVMGLADGSLAAKLAKKNPPGTPAENVRGLPGPDVIGYIAGAAAGIDYLNAPNHGLEGQDGPIIHCDIKPDNLLLTGGRVTIADCGVAVIVTPDARQTRMAGSPAYSPPELHGNKPGPGTDQYALAVTYYELRTGRLPFPDGLGPFEVMLVHANGELDFSSGQITDGERHVLQWATAKAAADRYPSCRAMADDLRKAFEGRRPTGPDRNAPAATFSVLPPVMVPPPPPPPPPAPVPVPEVVAEPVVLPPPPPVEVPARHLERDSTPELPLFPPPPPPKPKPVEPVRAEPAKVEPPKPAPAPPPPPPPAPGRRFPVWPVVGGAVAAVAVGGYFVMKPKPVAEPPPATTAPPPTTPTIEPPSKPTPAAAAAKLAQEAGPLRQSLAALADDPGKAAEVRAAVEKWTKERDRLAGEYGAAWSAELLPPEVRQLVATATAWAAGGDTFRTHLLAGPPAEPRAMLREFARSKATLADRRAVRDAARKWPGFDAAEFDAAYQKSLAADMLKRLEDGPLSVAEIEKLCGTDAAEGWAELARAEAERRAPAGGEPTFRAYLTAVAAKDAARLAAAYSPPPKLLLAPPRKQVAAGILRDAAVAQLKADFADPPRLTLSLAARNWLATAAKLTTDPRTQALAGLTADPPRTDIPTDALDAVEKVIAADVRKSDYATAADPLVDWFEQEWDRAAAGPEQVARRETTMRILARWKATATDPADRDRIALARGRILARFNETYSKEIDGGGLEDALTALKNLPKITATDRGRVALLCDGAASNYAALGGDKGRAGTAWQNLFRLADEALTADPDCPPAHYALLLAISQLDDIDPAYRTAMRALNAEFGTSPTVDRYLPTDGQRFARLDDHYTKAALRKPHRRDAFLYAEHATLVLRHADRVPDRAEFARALHLANLSLADKPTDAKAVRLLMAEAAEGVAWTTAPPTDAAFAAALSEYAAAEPTGAERAKWLVARGRCEYRAAAFGTPGKFAAATAVATLTEAVAAKLPAKSRAEARFWLARAKAAAGDAADAAFQAVIDDPAADSFRLRAAYDRARFAKPIDVAAFEKVAPPTDPRIAVLKALADRTTVAPLEKVIAAADPATRWREDWYWHAVGELLARDAKGRETLASEAKEAVRRFAWVVPVAERPGGVGR